MATVTRENIGLLNDKISVQLSTSDYLPEFEKNLKQYAKTANIPGFRKGMVPAGLVKKMYGQGVFADQVIKAVEKQLYDYLVNEKIDIFAQPLPLENDSRSLDMNNPADYVFAFEIGLKPALTIQTENIPVTKYKVTVTDTMIDEEANRLQQRHGKMTEPEVVDNEDNVLNVSFAEANADGSLVENGIVKTNSLLVKYFAPSFRSNLMGKKKDDVVSLQLNTAFEAKELDVILGDLGLDKADASAAEKYFNLTITKVGFVEKAALDAEFFAAAYPGKEIADEAAFRTAIKEEIQQYYDAQARNQVQDQIYHHLIDHTSMDFPETFLKKWLQNGTEKQKTAEEAEAEYPTFANQLKWTLISSKLNEDFQITVGPDDIKAFAKQQLFSYMGGQMLDENQPWVEDYVNKMVKDKKYVEDSYHRISTEKLFALLEQKVAATEESISAEAFAEKLHHHHH